MMSVDFFVIILVLNRKRQKYIFMVKCIYPLLFILLSCQARTEVKQRYIITVDRKEYSPITQTYRTIPDIDTVYETNDLDAYAKGFIDFYAYQRANSLIKESNRLLQARSFSVIDSNGIDITYTISERQKDSITQHITGQKPYRFPR